MTTSTNRLVMTRDQWRLALVHELGYTEQEAEDVIASMTVEESSDE